MPRSRTGPHRAGPGRRRRGQRTAAQRGREKKAKRKRGGKTSGAPPWRVLIKPAAITTLWQNGPSIGAASERERAIVVTERYITSAAEESAIKRARPSWRGAGRAGRGPPPPLRPAQQQPRLHFPPRNALCCHLSMSGVLSRQSALPGFRAVECAASPWAGNPSSAAARGRPPGWEG